MNFSFDALLSQLWPLAIVGLILSVFIRKGLRKGLPERKTTDFRQVPTSLSGSGVSHPDAEPQEDGSVRYSGSTQGISWRLETVNLESEVDDGSPNRRTTSSRWTRWSTTVGGADRGVLLMMNLPDGASPETLDLVTKGDGGLIASLVDKAASLALNLYVRQRFGAERAGEADLQPAQRQSLGQVAFDTGYAVWCSNPRLLERLSGPVLDDLVAAHASGVAMLWDRSGLMLHWPMALTDPTSVAEHANLGARLASLLTDRQAFSTAKGTTAEAH